MIAEQQVFLSSADRQIRMDGYQAWLVDLDGTLYRATWVRLAMALELALGHWRAMAILRVFRQEHEQMRHETSVDTGVPYQLQLQRASKKVGLSPQELESLVKYWMQDRPGKWLRLFRRGSLLEQIDRYRGQGGRTALVSDYPARKKLGALGAGSLFDVVVANGEDDGPKFLKPHPAGYLQAAQRLGVEPQNCLVIGDRWDADGEAARRAGMGFRCI